MKLRPHHLLCIQKFTGHGYDAAFTAHMTAVVAALRAAPETPVTLTQGCDELCGRCPNNAHGVCVSLEKVDGMDGGVLAACGFAFGQSLPWEDAAEKARRQVFETEKFINICASCQWFALCREPELCHD